MAGTTLDVSDAVPGAIQRALAEVGVEVPEARIREVRGRAKLEALRTLLESQGRAAPGLAERVHARFREQLMRLASEGVRPIDGAAGAMAWLRDRGIPVWLTTGFDRELAQALLERVDWGPELVSGLVTSDDVARGRPDPAMIHLAMAHAAIDDPSVVVVVGDTRADLEAARAAGVGYAVGVLTGAHGRDELRSSGHPEILTTLSAVPDWLRQQGAVAD